MGFNTCTFFDLSVNIVSRRNDLNECGVLEKIRTKKIRSINDNKISEKGVKNASL